MNDLLATELASVGAGMATQEHARRCQGGLAGAATALLFLVYAPTIAPALRGADPDTLNVAVFAPWAAAWLIWSRRQQLRLLDMRVDWRGLLPMTAAALAWGLGEVFDANALRQLALVGMTWALWATVLGPTMGRALAAPAIFLLFATNLFFPLVPLLMQLTAWLGVELLRASGLPAMQDGLAILAPFGRWQVVEACSGLDYLLIFAMAAALYASLVFRAAWRRAFLIVIAAIAAIVANGFRAWAIVYLAYLRHGADQDHSIVGWTVFALAFVLLFAFAARWHEDPASAEPRLDERLGETERWPRGLRAVSATLAVGALLPLLLAVAQRHAAAYAPAEGCRTVEARALGGGADAPVRTRTECSGADAARELAERGRIELAELAPGAAMAAGLRAIDLVPGEPPLEVPTWRTLGTPVTYEVAYWYEVGGLSTASRWSLKWHLALARVRGQAARATVMTERRILDRPADGRGHSGTDAARVS